MAERIGAQAFAVKAGGRQSSLFLCDAKHWRQYSPLMSKKTKVIPSPLHAAVDKEAKHLPTLLGTLLAQATVNPPGDHYDSMVQCLLDELALVGVPAKKLTPPAKLQRELLPEGQKHLLRHNVLGKLKSPGARKTLHFNAHYDVVPVGGTWKQGDPFKAHLDKGWIYGRGSADMKGSIASLLTALRALKTAGIRPVVNLEISFTADEETDSVLGADWLVNNAPLNADAALVMEGAEGDQICCGHNGVVWLEVEVIGKAAHGSRPELGVNALEKMAALVLALEHYKELLKKDTFHAPDGTLLVPTINVGGVFEQGPGGKINTVPASARFTIDRRVTPGESARGAENELRDILSAAASCIPDCRIKVRKISDNHPSYSEPSAPAFACLARSIEAVRGNKVDFCVSTGFTDMHFFAHHLGIPTMGYGPGGEGEHAVNERARLKDLVDCAQIYARMLTDFTG